MKRHNVILLDLMVVFLVGFAILIVGGRHKFDLIGERDIFKAMVDSSVLIYSDDGSFGSGVVFKDNIILTAKHCLLNKKEITVELSDGRIFKSKDFYCDDREDVGFIVVDIDKEILVKRSIRDLDVGNTVYLIGTPYLMENRFSLYDGVVSYLGRDINAMGWEDMIQTTIDSGPGCSGGGLFNVYGNLVGICAGQFGNGLSLSVYENLESIDSAYNRFCGR